MNDKQSTILQSILFKFSKHLALIVIIAIVFKSKISSSISEIHLFVILVFAVFLSIIGKHYQEKSKIHRTRKNYDL